MSVSLVCKSVPWCRRVFPTLQKRRIIDMSYSQHFMDYKSSSIPSSMKKMMVTKLSPDFREAVSIQTVPVPTPSDRELLIRNRYIGINASDINYSAGRYNPSLRPPFPVGFEGVGEVVALGLSASSRFTVGDAVAYLNAGAFAEYSLVSVEKAIPLKKLQPEALTVIVSGVTALIALQCLGELKKGKRVLVTAAAGGTGHFAVQFAKMAGCHVIGTCSSREKVEFLKTLGCDRPINYKEEDLGMTLRREYPKGVDVVYESVGGAVFDLAVNNLAKCGRLIVLGFISGYQSESGMHPINGATLPAKLLKKSASVSGFFLEHFLSEYRGGVQKIMQMHEEGKILCAIDDGQMDKGGRFVGLESVYTAIDYMYSGKNKGKVVLELNPEE